MKIEFLILLLLFGFSCQEQPLVHPNTGAIKVDSSIIITATDSTVFTLSGDAMIEFEKRIGYFKSPMQDFWFEIYTRKPIFTIPENKALIDSLEQIHDKLPNVVSIVAILGDEVKESYLYHKSHDCFDVVDGSIHTFCNYEAFFLTTGLDGKSLALEDSLDQSFYKERFGY